MNEAFSFKSHKRFAAVIAALVILALFVQWGKVPAGIQAVELMLNPVIHREIVAQHALRFGEDPLFITAVMKVESNFIKSAKSPRGAVGLMQVMPATGLEMAQGLGLKDYKPEDLAQPDTNILIGTYYISRLRKEYDSDNILLLAAYNAGGKNVREWLKERNQKSLNISDIKFPETRKFVKEVLGTYQLLKRLQVWRERVVRWSNRKGA